MFSNQFVDDSRIVCKLSIIILRKTDLKQNLSINTMVPSFRVKGVEHSIDFESYFQKAFPQPRP